LLCSGNLAGGFREPFAARSQALAAIDATGTRECACTPMRVPIPATC